MDTKASGAAPRAVHVRQGTADDATILAPIAYNAFKTFNMTVNTPPEVDFVSEEGALLMLKAMFEEEGSYAAVALDRASGQLLGSGFLHRTGPYLRSVGPISVNPSNSDKGVGRSIMVDLIAKAREQGARSIRLQQVATNTKSFSLYSSLGFVPKECFSLFRITAQIDEAVAASVSAGFPPRTDAHVRQMEEADVEECAKLCQQAVGFDRSEDIRRVLSPKAWVLVSDSKVVAYTTGFTFFGHTIATDELNFVTLFIGLLPMSGEHLPFFLHIAARLNPRLMQWAMALKMTLIRFQWYMVIGEYQETSPGFVFFPSIDH